MALLAPVDASLTITKTVVGQVPSDSWTFSGPTGTFPVTAAGGVVTFPGLAPGSYTISETVKSGYTATVACTDGSSGAASVTVNLVAGSTVGCTFTNTHSGSGEAVDVYIPAVRKD